MFCSIRHTKAVFLRVLSQAQQLTAKPRCATATGDVQGPKLTYVKQRRELRPLRH